jgi:hypothetical protein
MTLGCFSSRLAAVVVIYSTIMSERNMQLVSVFAYLLECLENDLDASLYTGVLAGTYAAPPLE